MIKMTFLKPIFECICWICLIHALFESTCKTKLFMSSEESSISLKQISFVKISRWTFRFFENYIFSLARLKRNTHVYRLYMLCITYKHHSNVFTMCLKIFKNYFFWTFEIDFLKRCFLSPPKTCILLGYRPPLKFQFFLQKTFWMRYKREEGGNGFSSSKSFFFELLYWPDNDRFLPGRAHPLPMLP